MALHHAEAVSEGPPSRQGAGERSEGLAIGARHDEPVLVTLARRLLDEAQRLAAGGRHRIEARRERDGADFAGDAVDPYRAFAAMRSVVEARDEVPADGSPGVQM